MVLSAISLRILADSFIQKKLKLLIEKIYCLLIIFGIEAWDTTRGNGIRDLRKELVEKLSDET